ncbi:MAG: hypothetical protein EON48_00530 [Acetobacteraceae bacterium]|nr:MAG: hypothetical protein EON48_00530 [Acetobacteraceae bacterium]
MPSNVAAGLAAIAALAATVSVIDTLVGGSQFEAWGNPLYWLCMLPMVWWVSGLTTFAPRYICCWGLAMLLACAASGISLVIVVWRTGAWILTLATATCSRVLYRRSLLAREGPTR